MISNDVYNDSFPDILVCVITSNLFTDEYSVGLKDSDLESGLLPETSVIKCHKLFTIEQTQIVKRFSTITDQKFSEVVNILHTLIKH